eukprot:715925-Pyramimonas_sp.AAC.2
MGGRGPPCRDRLGRQISRPSRSRRGRRRARDAVWRRGWLLKHLRLKVKAELVGQGLKRIETTLAERLCSQACQELQGALILRPIRTWKSQLHCWRLIARAGKRGPGGHRGWGAACPALVRCVPVAHGDLGDVDLGWASNWRVRGVRVREPEGASIQSCWRGVARSVRVRVGLGLVDGLDHALHVLAGLALMVTADR